MAQDKYSFNGFTPTRQPLPPKFSFATTSTSDSGRSQLGVATNKTLFTVEAYTITFPKLWGTDMTGILQAVKGKSSLSFHYFSPYYGTWRTDQFYVANVESTTVFAKEGHEWIDGLTFQITGVNPL